MHCLIRARATCLQSCACQADWAGRSSRDERIRPYRHGTRARRFRTSSFMKWGSSGLRAGNESSGPFGPRLSPLRNLLVDDLPGSAEGGKVRHQFLKLLG